MNSHFIQHNNSIQFNSIQLLLYAKMLSKQDSGQEQKEQHKHADRTKQMWQKKKTYTKQKKKQKKKKHCIT